MDNWQEEYKKLDKPMSLYKRIAFIDKAIIEAKIEVLKELQGVAGIQSDKIIYRKLKQLTCKHDGRTNPDPLGGIFCVECGCFMNKDKLEQLKTK